ncbi:MAG: hypothetical protein WCZ23_17970 [Rhodospirillaceae bacterium]
MFRSVVRLPHAGPSVMAVGAFSEASVCVTRGDEAFISARIDDLPTTESPSALQDVANALCIDLGVLPLRIAHDSNPDFTSTRFARNLGVPTVAVHPHHALAAAIAAEHGVDSPLLALTLDAEGAVILRVDGPTFEGLGRHEEGAAALGAWAVQAAEATGLHHIALSATGVFDTASMSLLADYLSAHGLSPLTCRNGLTEGQCLSLGQAWVALQTAEL